MVAALVEAHPDHEKAFQRLAEVRRSQVEGLIATHSVAEAYAVLSSLPISPRISPSAASALIEHSVLPYVRTVDLPARVVRHVVERLARRGFSGGVVYDALVAEAASKGGADCLYTLNPEDFRRVLEPGSMEIREP